MPMFVRGVGVSRSRGSAGAGPTRQRRAALELNGAAARRGDRRGRSHARRSRFVVSFSSVKPKAPTCATCVKKEYCMYEVLNKIYL